MMLDKGKYSRENGHAKKQRQQIKRRRCEKNVYLHDTLSGPLPSKNESIRTGTS